MNFIDLQKQYLAYQSEIDTAIQKVITEARFIMGPEIVTLEQELASFTDVNYALTCSSGTDALVLALMALDVKPGDEIITTPFSFFAAVEVIAFLKAKPVFVDIDPQTYNIDPKKIEAAVTGKTKGIIPVDIFGQCADYDEIRTIAEKYNLFVIEDGAQSFGAQYKKQKSCSFGDISCTSFFPAKPLGCFGDGGAVFTNDEEIALTINSLRVHGKGSHKYDHERIGINGRLDTLQAAVLSVKLKHFQNEIESRNRIADYYTRHLNDICVTPFISLDNYSVYAQYVIQIEKRDAVQQFLNERDIPTAIHYPKPLHLQPAVEYLGYKPGSFPIAEQLCEKVLALPMHPFLTESEQDEIISAIKEGLRLRIKD